MKKVLLLSITLLLAAASSGWAEGGVSIETSISSSRVELGDQVTMELIISNAQGKISKPTIGTLDGFTAYSQGHSQEISIVNGQMTSRSVFSYSLMANSLGRKKIGPFEVVIGGKSFQVSPVEVEVVSSGGAGGGTFQPTTTPSGPVQAPPSRALPTGNVSDKDIFVQAWLDKDDVFVNEPILLTYTFYTRLSATYKGFDKEPVTKGFWVEDFPPEKTIKRTEKIIDGSRYVVADVRKLILFPTDAGVFSFEPGTLSADVEIREDDPFDHFFSSNIFGRRNIPSSFMSQIVSKNLTVAPVQITVKALPEKGRPASFNGAVGNYLIESLIDKNEASVGDPITYRIRVWGEGNINTLQMPTFPKLDHFKIYDSSSSSNISKERFIVEGEKIVETVIVPKKPGKFSIPPVEFSYFDPKDSQYKVMKTDEQFLTITGTEQAEDIPTSTAVSTGTEPVQKEDLSVLAKDIRFIKTTRPFRAFSGYDFYRKSLYWWAVAILFFGWMIFGFLAAVRNTDGLAGLKDLNFRKAHAIARQKLKKSKRLLREDKQEEFYVEISNAVYGYFAGRLEVSPQAVSLAVIEKRAGEELSGELFGQIKKLLEELSAGRFALSKKGLEDMQDLYRLADQVITHFERVKL